MVTARSRFVRPHLFATTPPAIALHAKPGCLFTRLLFTRLFVSPVSASSNNAMPVQLSLGHSHWRFPACNLRPPWVLMTREGKFTW